MRKIAVLFIDLAVQIHRRMILLYKQCAIMYDKRIRANVTNAEKIKRIVFLRFGQGWMQAAPCDGGNTDAKV